MPYRGRSPHRRVGLVSEPVEVVQDFLQGLTYVADRVVVDALELVVEALEPTGYSFSEALPTPPKGPGSLPTHCCRPV
jgi:hypothetical protein